MVKNTQMTINILIYIEEGKWKNNIYNRLDIPKCMNGSERQLSALACLYNSVKDILIE
jgi:hypothetical protein